MKIQSVLTRIAKTAGLFGLMLVLFAGTAMAAETKIDEKNFPDEVFREWVADHYDTDGNGSLSAAEIAAVTEINIDDICVEKVKGIEFFRELQYFSADDSSLCGHVDLSKNTKLKCVTINRCYDLTSLDVSGCVQLAELGVSVSSLRKLDLSKNTELKVLFCNYNELLSLDLSNNTELKSLFCIDNRLTSLDTSKLTELVRLVCGYNYFTTLNVTKNTKLEYLDCSNCALTSLVTGTANSSLMTILCQRNQLRSLDVSGTPVEDLNVVGNLLTTKTVKLNAKLQSLVDTTSPSANGYRELISYKTFLYEAYTTNTLRYVPDVHAEVGEDVTIWFYLDDATGSRLISANATAGKEFTIPKTDYAPSLWYFLGWALSPTAAEPQFKTGSKITVYRDTILYPVLRKKTYKVTFDLNGGTSGAPAPITGISYNTAGEIPASSPVREGYYFLGWAYKPDSTSYLFKSGDATAEWNKDTVLYAAWKPRTNKISFNVNGGSGTAPSTISVLSGNTAMVPKASLTRSGYWFLGWSTDKNAATAKYKSGDKLSVTKDTVLYAVWKLDGYMLTFDANGGTNPPAKITAAKGATVTIPKSSVARDGYWFLGWATSKTAATAQYKSNDKIKLTANTTLYAVWKKK